MYCTHIVQESPVSLFMNCTHIVQESHVSLFKGNILCRAHLKQINGIFHGKHASGSCICHLFRRSERVICNSLLSYVVTAFSTIEPTDTKTHPIHCILSDRPN